MKSRPDQVHRRGRPPVRGGQAAPSAPGQAGDVPLPHESFHPLVIDPPALPVQLAGDAGRAVAAAVLTVDGPDLGHQLVFRGGPDVAAGSPASHS